MNAPRRLPLARTLRAVAWSFFGVRRGAAHEEDLRHLNPALVIAVGIAAAIALVAALLLLATWVVDSGVAA
ncbi:DUF2970 domain-containing protein [Rubrivivax gelatinosus]|uniref:DUF2970 domain-containing protein n=1 Tax=Rubrivivax gelatinosus TaxID=28068 RepID=UPI000309740C|nr:DUF2970 domain-containing protein [Rubrivivax gelatinosus]MBG6079452.1 hypothetical protein [Rubrivivax gelatinosus]